MKRIALLLVCVVAVFALTAQSPHTVYEPGSDPQVPQTWWPDLKSWIQYEESFGRSLSPRFLGKTIAEEGRIYLAVLCKEGDSLNLGDCAVWDTTRILVCDTTATDTARIENNLTAEGGAHGLYVFAKTGSSSDDSLWIYGADADGAAQSEILAIADGDDQVLTPSAYWWTDIDSVKDLQSTSGWTTYQVIALPICGVRGSDGASGDFAGIVSGGYDATGAWEAFIPDNQIGFIVIEGITDASISIASDYIWPGKALYPAASGKLAIAANTGTMDFDTSGVGPTVPLSLTIQPPVARALELGTTDGGLIKVFVK